MKNTLGQIWQTLANAYDSAWNLLVLNVIWVLLTLLAFGLADLSVYGVSQALPAANPSLLGMVYYLVLIFLNAFPIAGLFYAVRQIVENDYDGIKSFLTGIRRAWRVALLWLVLNGVVVFAISFYMNMVGGQGTLLSMAGVSVLIALLLWWLLTQVYAFPLALYQEQPSILRALRNSLVVYAKFPGYTFGITLIILLLALISYFFRPLVYIFSAALIVFLACAGVAHVLDLLNPPVETDAGNPEVK